MLQQVKQSRRVHRSIIQQPLQVHSQQSLVQLTEKSRSPSNLALSELLCSSFPTINTLRNPQTSLNSTIQVVRKPNKRIRLVSVKTSDNRHNKAHRSASNRPRPRQLSRPRMRTLFKCLPRPSHLQLTDILKDLLRGTLKDPRQVQAPSLVSAASCQPSKPSRCRSNQGSDQRQYSRNSAGTSHRSRVSDQNRFSRNTEQSRCSKNSDPRQCSKVSARNRCNRNSGPRQGNQVLDPSRRS